MRAADCVGRSSLKTTFMDLRRFERDIAQTILIRERLRVLMPHQYVDESGIHRAQSISLLTFE